MTRKQSRTLLVLKTISTVTLLPRIIFIFTYLVDKSMLNSKKEIKLGFSE